MSNPSTEFKAAIDVEESKLGRRVLSLAWPVVAEQSLMVAVGLVNTFMVGQFGSASLAAVGVAGQTAMLPMFFVSGVTIGSTAIVARHIGAHEPEEANRALRQSIVLAALIGLVATIIVWICADPLMRFFRATGDVVSLGTGYSRAYAATYVLSMSMWAGNAALRGAGNTRTPMMVMIVVNILNATLGWVFIFGNLGAPRLGAIGAGIAAGISRGLGGLIVLTILTRGSGVLKYDVRHALTLDRQMMKRIVNVGLPSGIEQAQMRVAMMIYSIIIFRLGTAVQAAYAAAIQIENMAFMPGFGFSIAATALMGQGLGAKRPDLAEKSAKLAVLYAAILMTTAGVITFIFGRYIMAIFASEPEVISLGHLYLKMFAFAMPLMAAGTALSGGLRGAGDTRWVMLLNSLGPWLARVPIGFVCSVLFPMGPGGAWSGAVVDLNLRGILVWLRFRTGRWKHIEV